MPLTINTVSYDMDAQQSATTPAIYTARVGNDPAAWKTARINVSAGNQKTRSKLRGSVALPVFDASGVFLGQALATISIDIPAGALIAHRTELGLMATGLASQLKISAETLKPNP